MSTYITKIEAHTYNVVSIQHKNDHYDQMTIMLFSTGYLGVFFVVVKIRFKKTFLSFR